MKILKVGMLREFLLQFDDDEEVFVEDGWLRVTREEGALSILVPDLTELD